MGFYMSNPLFYRKCHIERIHMPSLLAHQPGPVSHTGVTFSEKFAQIWTKNIENVENRPKWVEVGRYEPILREHEATPSLKPLAHPVSPESPKILENPRNPGIPLLAPIGPLGPWPWPVSY